MKLKYPTNNSCSRLTTNLRDREAEDMVQCDRYVNLVAATRTQTWNHRLVDFLIADYSVICVMKVREYMGWTK